MTTTLSTEIVADPFTLNGVADRYPFTIEWVPLSAMAIHEQAQRDIKNEKVNEIVQGFKPAALGVLAVNLIKEDDGRDVYYVMDGQHRKVALEVMGRTDRALCAVYRGLTLAQEAEMFALLNNRLAVSPQAKFKVAATAGDPDVTAIVNILSRLGLSVGRRTAGGGVTAVGVLRKVYNEYGPEVLSRTLALLTQGLGDTGLSAELISGMAMFLGRYGQKINDDDHIAKLLTVNAGGRGLIATAKRMREDMRTSLAQCVAASLVHVENKTGRAGRQKLPTWWALDTA